MMQMGHAPGSMMSPQQQQMHVRVFFSRLFDYSRVFFRFFWPLSNVLLIVSFNSNKRANKHTSRLNNNRFSSKLSIKLNNNSSECKNQVLLQS